MIGTLIQIDGYDPVAATPVTLRLASHDDAALCVLDGQAWWPVIETLPTLAYDLSGAGEDGQIATPASTLVIGVEPWPLFGRYALADARIRIWRGEIGEAFTAYSLWFDGRVTANPDVELGRASIPFAVDDRWLDTPVLATYAGSGGAEGAASLKGTVKPLALGAPRFVSGALIDPATSLFQISAYGAIEDVEAALERAARYGASAGDYASHAALVAAAIPAGRWATCKAEGKVRFGAPTQGQISFMVKGDKAGPDGWARKPGQLIRRIALMVGGTGKIHDASLNALDVARPYNLSRAITAQTTGRELIQRIAASVNAVAGVTWLGKLFVVPIGIGAPTLTLRADGSALPAVASVERLGTAPPWWRLAMEAERTETVHALGDIASTAPLIDMGAYDPARTNREGNIVQQGGSSWLYINPTPSAGNAPPVPPTTSNSWWKVLAQAGADGRAGADNLLSYPVTMETAAAESGSPIRQDLGPSATTPRDRYRLVLTAANQKMLIQAEQFGVFPGEDIWLQAQLFSSATGNAFVSINFFDLNGAYVSEQAPIQITGTGSASGWMQRRAKVAVPSNAAKAVPYFYRGAGTGEFYLSEPYVGRAEPGATSGAPIGTVIGNTPAGNIESSVNNGLGTDGVVKPSKVVTDSIVPNNVVVPYSLVAGDIAVSSGSDVVVMPDFFSVGDGSGGTAIIEFTCSVKSVVADKQVYFAMYVDTGGGWGSVVADAYVGARAGSTDVSFKMTATLKHIITASQVKVKVYGQTQNYNVSGDGSSWSGSATVRRPTLVIMGGKR